MENLEKNLKGRLRKSKIQKIILTSLYVAGVLSLAVLAPNALAILKQFDRGKIRRKNPLISVNAAITRLRERGLVVWEKSERGVFLRLTRQGEQSLTAFEKKGFKLATPAKWDGKWRVIIFDIHETKRGVRNKFRSTLMQIGFLKLQQSVWVYPYDCEELIALLKTDFKIGKDILYMIVDSIENDSWLQSSFNLKKT